MSWPAVQQQERKAATELGGLDSLAGAEGIKREEGSSERRDRARARPPGAGCGRVEREWTREGVAAL